MLAMTSPIQNNINIHALHGAVAEVHGKLRGELRFKEPMSAHASWRAGGCAEHCYIPADLTDLARFLRKQSGRRSTSSGWAAICWYVMAA